MRLLAFVLIFLLLVSFVSSWRRRRRRRCYRDCGLSPWGAWSSCSATCGSAGVRTRRRTKTYSEQCGGRCWSLTQTLPCNKRCCPRACSYYYTPWSSCVGCGTHGTQYRRLVIRSQPSCGGRACPRAGTSYRSCNPGR